MGCLLQGLRTCAHGWSKRDRSAGSVALEGSRIAADVTALFKFGMKSADTEGTGTDGNDGNDTSTGIDTVGGGKIGTENCTVGGGGSDTDCWVGVGANGGGGVGAISVDVGIGGRTFEYKGLGCAFDSCSHACHGSGEERGSTESTRVGSRTASSGGIG